jgi:hypothetical protein
MLHRLTVVALQRLLDSFYAVRLHQGHDGGLARLKRIA